MTGVLPPSRTVQSQYGVRRPAVRCASRARSLAATKLKPGGVINPFCDPAIATSTPQASIANGTQPSIVGSTRPTGKALI
jgi:hypothetical protein